MTVQKIEEFGWMRGSIGDEKFVLWMNRHDFYEIYLAIEFANICRADTKRKWFESSKRYTSRKEKVYFEALEWKR